MPTSLPRITVTLPKLTHEVLLRAAAASGESMSQIVAEFVELAVPSLERLVVVLERARDAPQEVRTGLKAAVERAERDLLPGLVKAMGQGEMFLGDLAYLAESTARDARSAPAPSRPSRARATPVPVTRGSGGQRKARKGRDRG